MSMDCVLRIGIRRGMTLHRSGAVEVDRREVLECPAQRRIGGLSEGFPGNHLLRAGEFSHDFSEPTYPFVLS